MMWQQRSYEFWKSNHSLYSEIMQGETQQIVAPTQIMTCSPAEDLFQMVQVTSFTPLCNNKFCSPSTPLVVLITSIGPKDWDSVHHCLLDPSTLGANVTIGISFPFYRQPSPSDQ